MLIIASLAPSDNPPTIFDRHFREDFHLDVKVLNVSGKFASNFALQPIEFLDKHFRILDESGQIGVRLTKLRIVRHDLDSVGL